MVSSVKCDIAGPAIPSNLTQFLEQPSDLRWISLSQPQLHLQPVITVGFQRMHRPQPPLGEGKDGGHDQQGLSGPRTLARLHVAGDQPFDTSLERDQTVLRYAKRCVRKEA